MGDAILYKRGEMNHYLKKVPKALNELLLLIKNIKNTMEENLLSKVEGGIKLADQEIDMVAKTDQEAKFGNSVLKGNIKRAGSFLNTIDEKILRSEQNLQNNADLIQSYIDKKAAVKDEF